MTARAPIESEIVAFGNLIANLAAEIALLIMIVLAIFNNSNFMDIVTNYIVSFAVITGIGTLIIKRLSNS